MDSSFVRKMLKARVYVEEPDRVNFTRLTAEFRGDNSTHIITFEANEPDLVLMGQPPSGLDVEASVFMDNPLIMIAAPDHPLAQSQEITLDLLAKETFVVREFGSGTRLAMERFFAEDGFVPRSTVEMTGNEVIKQGVEVGLGLSIISVHTAELELSAGRLVSLDVLRMPIVRRWYVAHRKGKRLSPTALLFKQYVLEEGLRQSKE